jgi:hypothetical protein
MQMNIQQSSTLQNLNPNRLRGSSPHTRQFVSLACSVGGCIKDLRTKMVKER